jgi:hypothetical protein
MNILNALWHMSCLFQSENVKIDNFQLAKLITLSNVSAHNSSGNSSVEGIQVMRVTSLTCVISLWNEIYAANCWSLFIKFHSCDYDITVYVW